MANECPMLVLSSVGVEEEEDEIELSLGLSIGGSFRKSTKLKPEEQKSIFSCEKVNSEPTNVDTDLNQENQCFSKSSMTQTLVGDSEPESGSEYIDPQRKRVIHALRRQEARKKREEKLRKGLGRGTNTMNGGVLNGGLMVSSDFADNKMWLEAQLLRNRARDRETRENEANVTERTCKRDKNEVVGSKSIVKEKLKDLNLMLNDNEPQNVSHGSTATAYGSSPSPIPVVPVQFPYPPLQYVPFANGFAYPCVMPCWAPTAGRIGNKINGKNVQKPVVGQSFQPYQRNDNSDHNPMMGSDSEHSSGKDGNRNAVSNGSPVCSSSVVSDHRSTCRQGGSSSDTGSHSSHCKPDQSQLNAASKTLEQSELSFSSHQVDSTQADDKAATYAEKVVSSGVLQSSPTTLSEQTKSETIPDPVKKPINSQNPNPGLLKVASGDLGKPLAQCHNTPSFSQMPCVSTTGNGPNGKTITGFLYRYTQTEVSIVCVCHGSSFTPAEFVEHAGGKDISHPLRHITVIPSAFG